jgi:hypothetical protein
VHPASYLLQMLLTILSGHGLVPEALDPWRAWVCFKQFVRVVDESPDPGVSVQLTKNRHARTVSLMLLRQAVEAEADWLEPTGGVVVELTFTEPDPQEPDQEFWSFDFGTFARFVDIVEQAPAVADRFLRSPVRTSVYWQDAL